MNARPRKWETAVYVLYMLGGDRRRISTEALAQRCYGLAWGWFCGDRRPQTPGAAVVLRALRYAKTAKPSPLVDGRVGPTEGHSQGTCVGQAVDGWRLTEAGARWIFRNEERLSDEFHWGKITEKQQIIIRKLARIRQSPLYGAYLEQPEAFGPAKSDLAGLFRCRPEADWRTWEKRFETNEWMAVLMNEWATTRFVWKCRASVRAQVDFP